MKPPPETQALERVVERLGALLDLPPVARNTPPRDDGVDRVVAFANHTFAIEWKASGAVAAVSMAAQQVRRYADARDDRVVPLVAVPFMGPVGRERCEREGVAWLDLSGNARIIAPGIRVLIEGKPNLFKRRGRPSSPFAPKGARIARWLLMHPSETFTQRAIAIATDMDEGYTSRIVARLEEDGLIERNDGGAVRVAEPNVLLDAWREDYDFSKHRIVRGHVPARTGDVLLQTLVERLTDQDIDHAVTGSAAAWLMTRFAAFRLVTLYVAEDADADLLPRLDIREADRGENVWLVLPNDAGVFHGCVEREGVRCVHPVQAYLDLLAQPERASEAAGRLRAELLTWNVDGG